MRAGLAPLGAALRAGAWDYGAAARPLHRLRGRTLGVVGLGRIGRRLAAKARALELRILGTDPAVVPAEAARAGIDWRPLPDLLAESDFVSLHAPLLPATEGLIGRAELARLGPGAYLINVAWGGLVDESALLEALDGRRLAGAGLDVLPWSPAPAGHPLIGHPRVVMTPHSAWYSEEAMRDLQRLLAEDVLRVLRESRHAARWRARGTEQDEPAQRRSVQVPGPEGTRGQDSGEGAPRPRPPRRGAAGAGHPGDRAGGRAAREHGVPAPRGPGPPPLPPYLQPGSAPGRYALGLRLALEGIAKARPALAVLMVETRETSQ